MTLATRSVYVFGSHRLDPVNRLLLRDGTRVPLKPKTLQMLLLLVEGRGDVLTKDQLMGTLWPDTFVEEANLTQHAATLRKALAEGATCRYIETVPKLGYRFVAPVEIVVSERPSSAVSRPSLAVLPFSLFGAEATDSYLSLGIADTLITKLGQSARILCARPAPSPSTNQSLRDAIQIGRLLNVDFVLTGRVYKQGEIFRSNLELVRVADETLIWTQQFDLTCANVFAVENSVLRSVERALLPAITGIRRKRKRQTRSGIAYRAYLKGRYFWNKRSAGDLRKGVACFIDAIAIDESYALAYAGLADSYPHACQLRSYVIEGRAPAGKSRCAESPGGRSGSGRSACFARIPILRGVGLEELRTGVATFNRTQPGGDHTASLVFGPAHNPRALGSSA